MYNTNYIDKAFGHHVNIWYINCNYWSLKNDNNEDRQLCYVYQQFVYNVGIPLVIIVTLFNNKKLCNNVYSSFSARKKQATPKKIRNFYVRIISLYDPFAGD